MTTVVPGSVESQLYHLSGVAFAPQVLSRVDRPEACKFVLLAMTLKLEVVILHAGCRRRRILFVAQEQVRVVALTPGMSHLHADKLVVLVSTETGRPDFVGFFQNALNITPVSNFEFFCHRECFEAQEKEVKLVDLV